MHPPARTATQGVLLFHSLQVHHEFVTYNLVLQGMAPASSGYAAGLTSQMVGGESRSRPRDLCCACHLQSHLKPGHQDPQLLLVVAAGCMLPRMICSQALRNLSIYPPPLLRTRTHAGAFWPSTAAAAPTIAMRCSAAAFMLLLSTCAGAFWPSTTGEPHHLMAFFNSTIRLVSATCGANSTAFSVAALHQVGGVRWSGCPALSLFVSANSNLHLHAIIAMMGRHGALPRLHCLLRMPTPASMNGPPSLAPFQVLGRNDTITQLDDQTFFVGQRINGSYAVRILPTGDAGVASGGAWCMLYLLAGWPSLLPSGSLCDDAMIG